MLSVHEEGSLYPRSDTEPKRKHFLTWPASACQDHSRRSLARDKIFHDYAGSIESHKIAVAVDMMTGAGAHPPCKAPLAKRRASRATEWRMTMLPIGGNSLLGDDYALRA